MVKNGTVESDVEKVRHEYELKLKKMKESYEGQLKNLSERAAILEEKNASQRVMLEDAINYSAGLEERIADLEKST
jgi:hypothetical protein